MNGCPNPLRGDVEAQVRNSPEPVLWAYLDGASRDGTFSNRHRTWRVSQRGTEWLLVLKLILARLQRKSWIYREGARDVFTLETTAPLRCDHPATEPSEAAAFVRGYFDAEGGVPRDPAARFYIQFVQRNRGDLERVRERMRSLGITCGRLHNPSSRVDPEYWRFYVASASTTRFLDSVGSWHPRKRAILEVRQQQGLVEA